MKRFVVLLLTLVVVFSAAACTKKTEETQNAASVEENVKNGPKGDIRLLSCRFAEEIRSADNEMASMLYTDGANSIYVDLRFSVNNRTEGTIGEEDITAWLTYQGVKQELRYCREGSSTGVDSEAVEPGTHSYVHLFAQLEKEAVGQEITVYYTVNGKEYDCIVAEKQVIEPLTGKTKATTGKTFSNAYGKCQVKVLDVGEVENLQASNQMNTYYSGPFMLVKVEITNEHPTQALKNLFAYVKMDGTFSRISMHVENADGTDMESFVEIAPGEKETVYLCYRIYPEQTRDDNLLRFNVAGACYYVELP